MPSLLLLTPEVLSEVRVLRSPSRGTKVPAARRLTVGGL
ncbi:hypothetical protein HD596_010069 [Nonomuraea jabiensis]|uniref:Uncharacterized protein n=1 Tax=Nonomuraea jabiensis TaxID=882448 RepID=A0A7W9LGX6_9ACTN|nr:hypothetical protein [Nonomuraea jabiensis]